MNSREYTNEEVRSMFLNHLNVMVRYWASDSRTMDKEEAMRGLIHSILTTIDGNSMLPAFSLMARPHPDDKEYHCGLGENYFPEPNIENDISGELRYEWARKYGRSA